MKSNHIGSRQAAGNYPGITPADLRHAGDTVNSDKAGIKNSDSSSEDNVHDYTVIAYLGVNFNREKADEMGALQELKEYSEKLAPQIKDKSLALTILGSFPSKDGGYIIKRYEIDCNGMRDTSDELTDLFPDEENVKSEGPLKDDGNRLYNKDVLKNFIASSMRKYPAEKYVFTINTHGGNSSGIGSGVEVTLPGADADKSDNRPCENGGLNLTDLRETFEAVRDETGRKLDIIDMDACIMGHVEVVSSLSDSADYIVASSTLSYATTAEKNIKTIHGPEIPRNCHQQVEVFEKILQNPGISPGELAREFVLVNSTEGQVREEKGENSWTSAAVPEETSKEYNVVPALSAYSTANIGNVMDMLDQVGSVMNGLFNSPDDKDRNNAGSILYLIDSCRSFNKERSLVDLEDFMDKTLTYIYGVPAEDPGREEVRQLIHSVSLEDYRGISADSQDYTKHGPIGVFLPGGKDSYFNTEMPRIAADTLKLMALPGAPAKLTEHINEMTGIYNRIMEVDPEGCDMKKPITVRDSADFWGEVLDNSREIGLDRSEIDYARKFKSLADSLSKADGKKPSPETDKKRKEYDSLIKDGSYLKAGAKKILEYRFSMLSKGFKKYEALNGLPSNWKEFVLSIKDYLLDTALGDMSGIY